MIEEENMTINYTGRTSSAAGAVDPDRLYLICQAFQRARKKTISFVYSAIIR